MDPSDLPPDAWADLAAMLGPGGVVAPTEDLAAYEQPARGTGGPAAAVVRPRSTDQVRAVLRWARRHRVRVLAQGANTGLVGASTPPPDGHAALVVLSTELMVDGLVVDPTDRTAVVPAGLRLSTLNDGLRPRGLWFPIDLAADPTLGGMVATNTGGARMLRHGDVRRRVLGVEVVTADEDVTVLDTLSVLRKDNTGPDLTSLFVGSAGMFGVVCRAALDLARIPADTAGMVVVPADGAAAVDLLTGLEEDLGDLLSAFEVMSAPAMDAALRHVGGLHHPFGGSPLPDLAVLVEVAGPAGMQDLLLGAVGRAVHGGRATEAVAMPLEQAWALRHALTEGLRRSGVVVGFDVSVPRSVLATYRDAVRTEVAARLPRAVVADFGHWGDGGMHCNLVFPPGAGPDDAERAAAREVVFGLAVERFGGSYSAEHGLGPHNADWWLRVTPPATVAAVRSLRDRFDPLGILGHPGLPPDRTRAH